MRSSFALYCATLTDAQLVNVLRKEDEGRKRDLGRETFYRDAREEMARRGMDPEDYTDED